MDTGQIQGGTSTLPYPHYQFLIHTPPHPLVSLCLLSNKDIRRKKLAPAYMQESALIKFAYNGLILM